MIETTGLADPAPILQTLMAHRGVARHFALDGVVTVVDAVNGPETLDAHPQSVKQVALADRIALAKRDIAGGDVALDPLMFRLRALNPAAPILDARHASAAELVLAAGFDLAGKPADAQAWLAADRYPDVHHGHRHDVSRHGDVRAFALTTDAAIRPWRLEQALDLVRALHGPALLRMKGIVKLAGDEGRPAVLHAVQHVLHPATRLAAWPGEDRRSRLVFIVRGIEPRVIEDLFASFFGEPRLDAPDAQALTNNPLALR